MMRELGESIGPARERVQRFIRLSRDFRAEVLHEYYGDHRTTLDIGGG